MAKHQLELFATSADFVQVLKAVEDEAAITFAVAGVFESSAVHMLESSADVLSAMVDSNEPPSTFLAIDRMESVSVREVPQKQGGSRYSVDQLNNPKSVVLRPGGRVDENTLLAGQIGTTTDAPGSLKLYTVFSRAVRRQFVKVQSYWVGPEAVRVLDGGGRLTANVKSSRDYDLRR